MWGIKYGGTDMKVLIVGSGGREHAIAASVAKSPQVDKIYCAPGNAGIAELCECVDIKAMELEKLAQFASDNKIDLTIIDVYKRQAQNSRVIIQG